MRPHEALPQDWNLYYNNTYMLHDTMGPVIVRVGDGYLYAKKAVRPHDDWQQVTPESLNVWFPRTGAFNTTRSAVYIARRAARSMRKSMTLGDLYYSKCGERVPTDVLAKYLVNATPSYTPGMKAIELLMDPTSPVKGRAISREYLLLASKTTARTARRRLIPEDFLEPDDEFLDADDEPVAPPQPKKVRKPKVTAYFKGHLIGTVDDNGIVILNSPTGPLARRIVRDLSREGVQCDSLIQ